MPGVINNRIETRSVRRLRTGPQQVSCSAWEEAARLSEDTVLKLLAHRRICGRNVKENLRKMFKVTTEQARSTPSFHIPSEEEAPSAGAASL